MWELDHKEDWALKNWCFWTVVLEKTLEHPLDCKEIKPVSSKGNHSWIFIGRTDAEAEVPILWPPDANSRLIRKDPDSGQDWRQEEKGTTGEEMGGGHHQFNGHEFEQTPGDSKGQGSLVCCSPWGLKELDTTEQLNNNWSSGNLDSPLNTNYSCHLRSHLFSPVLRFLMYKFIGVCKLFQINSFKTLVYHCSRN